MKINLDEARKMREDGKSYREIGEAFGASKQAARQALTYVSVRKCSEHLRDNIEPEITRLNAEGLTDLEISHVLGYSASGIFRIRARLGLPPRGKRGRPRKVPEVLP